MENSIDKQEMESDISGFVSTIFISDDAVGYDDEPQQALPVSDIGSISLDRDVLDMHQVTSFKPHLWVLNVMSFTANLFCCFYGKLPGSESSALGQSRGCTDAFFDR